MSKAYANAGVDLDRGYEVVKRIKQYAKKTHRDGVIGDIGAFGGLFGLDLKKYHDPVLVSGTDGVGTKLLLSTAFERFDTVGIDLVAMCVNDVVASGAEPLFFLDYIASGRTDPDQVEQVIKGISEGCVLSGCALIGGETAEMPGLYRKGHFDLAGFCVGVVERSKIIKPDAMAVGDILIGLKSSGIHSNGYSLVRKILAKNRSLDLDKIDPVLKSTPKEALMEPTKIYVKPILALIREVKVKGIAHITGGGFHENLPRMLKKGLGVAIDLEAIPLPPVFIWLAEKGRLDRMDMYHVFNMGMGMALVVERDDVSKTMDLLKANGETPFIAGEITNTSGVVFK